MSIFFHSLMVAKKNELIYDTMPGHEEIRNTQTWGTYGKLGDEPLKNILIKDISDNHLKNIINHIKFLFENNGYDGNYIRRDPTMKQMENEITYRTINNITVPEYGARFRTIFKKT